METCAPSTKYQWQSSSAALPEALREYFLRRRQVLMMELAELEDLLGVPRSITPKHLQPKGG